MLKVQSLHVGVVVVVEVGGPSNARSSKAQIMVVKVPFKKMKAQQHRFAHHREYRCFISLSLPSSGAKQGNRSRAMARLVVPIDLKKKPWEQKLPLHNRWHPEIPAVEEVRCGEFFRVEMVDFSGGGITKDYSAEDVKYVDPSIVSSVLIFLMSGLYTLQPHRWSMEHFSREPPSLFSFPFLKHCKIVNFKHIV